MSALGRALRSLRGRVALVATAGVAAVLLAVGGLVVASFSERERGRVDDELAARPSGGLVRVLGGPPGGPGPIGGPPPEGFGPRVLRPEGEYIRLISDGQVVRSVDPPDGLPLPEDAGLRTLEADGERYRSLTRQIPGGGLLEVGTALAPAEDRIDALRRRVIVLGVLGVALVAALSWWLAGLALLPLGALRSGAGRVSTTRDLSMRLPAEGAPDEVTALTESINAMLARLERSSGDTEAALQATRRFAGDAGHELRTPMTALRAYLGALRRNPDLDRTERQAALEGAEREAERAARLLEVLQTLARGDAGAALPRETVELSGLVESALEAARARHRETDWRLEEPAEDLELSGWPDGLRALVDNLLENAARHGRPGGTVEVTLGRNDNGLFLTVDDDGPGVPTAERERIFERFARGKEVGGEGSGLGLALVRQQARLLGGEVTVSDSPLGGARFHVLLGAVR